MSIDKTEYGNKQREDKIISGRQYVNKACHRVRVLLKKRNHGRRKHVRKS